MIKAVLVSLLLAGSLCAQDRGAAYIEKLLERAGLPKAPAPVPARTGAASAVESVRQVHVAWSGVAPAPRASAEPAASSYVLSERRFVSGLRRQRMPALGRNKLIAVAVDAQGRSAHWEILHDPRVSRAEFPTASGELKGVELPRTPADFVFAFPDNLSVASIRLYQPKWASADPVLELVGEFPLGGVR